MKRWTIRTLPAALTVGAAFAGVLWPAAPTQAQPQSRTVNVTITDSGFIPNQVLALVNAPITLNITNQGHQVHEFAIPYYRIYTADLQPGQKSTVSFSPWTAGQFDMISDPSGTNQPEFTGKFIVTDQK
ncbi:cupredoxin domain-containing protein [Alicyclobacillus cycloheptanicus]|uniref:Heme/copper-type cytochrome/quinol oxidase subunit 2 n=1 Tax=Alicyclobacillus cycloheptanicus TaxID=1457 RepID=A0ABT9XGZ4_9BACL|nr:cupredoxin domain-containing protein [Alicyclobacillus cycloheptanicus]MDQ0189567.1 heme/copper-type cytochrome/quinol oxidase subunit 2 [Alicyclobacillus cycloheptanicus]WDM01620.1 cupredoxin domain-containing protein [Alicyclobacillus cycloheptanicus]